jgi:UDP-galactopyranose mutase
MAVAPSDSLGDLSGLKYLVVGCGFFGAVMAERIASAMGEKVLVIDLRRHIGGNSYSYTEPDTKIEIHAYGSHIFHTSNSAVWEYVTSFEPFNNYLHKVYTKRRDHVYPMPINLHTINQFFGKAYGPDEARAFLENEIRKHCIASPSNLEEKAVSLIGRDLYEAFIKDYTWKQWDKDPRELPASIITRLPVRFNFNNRYFSDRWEGHPIRGYGTLFRKILAHPNISVGLGIDFFEIRNRIPKGCRIVYSGPIDRFFDYKHGVLGWRTSEFSWRRVETEDFQGTSVMNYADLGIPYTRIHEFRHYHPEREYPRKETIICEEYSRGAGEGDDPFYPISAEIDKKLFRLYKEECRAHPDVIFGGRLGNYVYIDMHQAVAMALNEFAELKKGLTK